jgi:hypothetical protein
MGPEMEIVQVRTTALFMSAQTQINKKGAKTVCVTNYTQLGGISHCCILHHFWIKFPNWKVFWKKIVVVFCLSVRFKLP